MEAEKSVHPPLVYVVILNWNRACDTIECLQSLARCDYANYQPLVVDNGSTDGSPGAIRAAFPAVEMIINENNLGFAQASNIGPATSALSTPCSRALTMFFC